MYKIKSLTKDEKLFSILLICFLLFDYFISGNSLLWLLYEIFVATGIYYLCCKSSLSKKFSKVTKAVIMFCLVALLIAPPLFIFKNNSWMYRTSEYVRTTGHFYSSRQFDYSESNGFSKETDSFCLCWT